MDVRVTSVEEMFASRSQAVTSFAETRVAGLSSLLESRCDAVLQSADAKLSGVQDALAAQIALSIPKLQQEVKEIAESLVSECRHTIVMDWQSLNVREHKEEIRREVRGGTDHKYGRKQHDLSMSTFLLSHALSSCPSTTLNRAFPC